LLDKRNACQLKRRAACAGLRDGRSIADLSQRSKQLGYSRWKMLRSLPTSGYSATVNSSHKKTGLNGPSFYQSITRLSGASQTL
jgi:hypothetical protein